MFPLLLPLLRVLLTNDDGWATASVRAQHALLNASNIQTTLCAPAENMSGSGSLDFPPTPRTDPCQWNTCPPGSSVGSNASDPYLNYVNSYPVTAVNYALTNLFTSPPDITISGPNIGSNIGMSVFVSGTIGAAAAAAQHGIPALAISAVSGDQLPYTVLQPSDVYSLHARLSLLILTALTSNTPTPILPPVTFLNINYPQITLPCTHPRAFSFVLTRAFALPFTSPLPPEHSIPSCRYDTLPLERDVLANTGSCQVAVSLLDAWTKMDAGSEAREELVQRLGGFLGCASAGV